MRKFMIGGRTLLWVLGMSLPLFASAQADLNWRQHLKMAEQLLQNSDYANAGEHYRQAWKQKPKHKEYIFKAGECFYTIRDYKNAADCYRHVAKNLEVYPLVGLKYGRALKQTGEYEKAIEAFQDFITRYEGQDKTLVSAVVQTELQGCELAQKLAATPDDELPARILHPGDAINTPETEFGPYPFSDDILYFSSNRGERAEIYFTQRAGGKWSKARLPRSFPPIDKDHYCNGTMSADQNRFYFTICKEEESWGGLTTRCEIFVTRRINKAWSAPVRLRDYINVEGATTTHPFVVQEGDTEILYFASNRKGGVGGMDIWYTTRDINSNDFDFTFPVNAGSEVNTLGDEITPYYDIREKALYFASNGHVSLGGYDIFRARGSRASFQKPENVGRPFNSSADDFFFIKAPSGRRGFLVSNRIFGMQKLTTTHEDIFEFEYTQSNAPLFAEGGIYAKPDGKMLDQVSVSLYQVLPSGVKVLEKSMEAPDGRYRFELEPDKQYVIEAMRSGYITNSYQFNTKNHERYQDFGGPIYLEKFPTRPVALEEPSEEKPKPSEQEVRSEPLLQEEVQPQETAPDPTPEPVREEPKINTSPEKDRQKGVVRTPSGKIIPLRNGVYLTRGLSPRDNYEILTSAPRLRGTYYKIQLIAVEDFNESHPRYREVKKLGRLDTEFILEKELYRVLLADYFDLEDAKKDLEKVQQYRSFRRAFIVEYRDGQRYGRVRF